MALAGFAALPVHAQDASGDTHRQSGSASARVALPLRATAERDLSFGVFTVAEGQNGEIAVGALPGDAQFSGGVRPVCAGGDACSPHAALFAISGDSDRLYVFRLPRDVSLTGIRGGQAMIVTDLTGSSQNARQTSGAGALDGGGEDVFSVGGRLDVPGNATPDSYSGEFTVTIDYL
ncbi:DUF4402 domain-containing protein [Aurantiacibacter sp. MUD61]|uniref:DUF4402 domain-containing protein n=1 Tax=Aurantiacibacter sp. MUD61 TaxID=3009083 RepID=UPI0022F039A6|nr:DUF4402 domain-containing protein [Aurantiacibacter sp. MUD61]